MNNQQQEEIKETGTIELENTNQQHKIKVFTIIGEIEGHDVASNNTKSTKYDHLLPQLAELEETTEIDGALFLLNTLGGDVEAGLAIAEMIASLSKPTVSLVLGGSHSIGGPLAVATNYSFIVPSGTMVIHPVRSNGMFIGVQQSLMNMIKTQDRITKFISTHSNISQKRVEEAYRDQDRWSRMALLQTASCGKFTSDRTIQEYVDEIWKLDKVVVKM